MTTAIEDLTGARLHRRYEGVVLVADLSAEDVALVAALRSAGAAVAPVACPVQGDLAAVVQRECARFWDMGIGPSAVLVVVAADGPADLAPLLALDQLEGPAAVGITGPAGVTEVLADQLRRRRDGDVPAPVAEPEFLTSRGVELPWGDPSDPAGAGTVCGLGNGKDGLFLDHLAREGAVAFPSTVALLHELRAGGVCTALVTASSNADQVLAAAGVADLFDARVDGVVAADLNLQGKPDPATFLEAARRLGVDPSRAAVVEDALAGVAAGAAGGFALVVGVAHSGDPESLRRAGAGVVVAELAELLGAVSRK